MFHKGARTAGGNFESDLSQKTDKLLNEFIEIVDNKAKNLELRRAAVRSLLPCSLIIIKDKDNLFVAAVKNLGMPSTISIDNSDKSFTYNDILECAIWEFGFDDPFLIVFSSQLLDQNTDNRKKELTAIALSHIESEKQRFLKMTNLIQINPIFGPAAYSVDNSLVFVLMPFDDDLTEIYKNIVKPSIETPGYNLKCKRADDFKTNKTIIQDIWKAICESKIIIADLTRLNANVMYELGIAHTIGKETILIYQSNNKDIIKFPFDLAHIRRIEYKNNAIGGRKLETELKATIESIIKPKSISK
jgi:hypothetical protein